jgi:4-amino-4-deoxy-L-arabinose transferase-like glycosyltransferase
MREALRSFFNPPNPDPFRAPRRIFWAGFLLRVLYLTLAHTYRIRPAEDHFQFGWEAGRIARALVAGYGYSDPFANVWLAHTGPTAWLPPLYPLLLAAIFKIFGVYTLKSAWVLFTVQSTFSAATALATYEIAARILDRRVALSSAWIWALYPAAMQYAVRWPWEMTITTALFTFTLALALRMRRIGSRQSEGTGNREQGTERQSQERRNTELGTGSTIAAGPLIPVPCSLFPARWLLFGLLWGLIALSNSTLLIFLPICGLWIMLPALRKNSGAPFMSHRRSGIAKMLIGPALAALVFLACIAPWTIRNQRVFHSFIPLRGNFGAELYMGNGPGAEGLLMEYYHPFQDPAQLRAYAQLGEVRYVARQGAAAKAVIAADPAHFAADIARRVYFFWTGVPHPADEAWYNEAGRTLNFGFISLAGLFGLALALRRRVPAAGLFAWAFLLLPIPYYLVTVHARFRHPLEPLICILGVYLFQSAGRSHAFLKLREGAPDGRK